MQEPIFELALQRKTKQIAPACTEARASARWLADLTRGIAARSCLPGTSLMMSERESVIGAR